MQAQLLSPRSDHIKSFKDAAEAVAYVQKIYENNTGYLQENFQQLIDNQEILGSITACYPYVAVEVGSQDLKRHNIDPMASYGFVSSVGRHATTLTRPDIFGNYYREMLETMISNHQVSVEVGVSDTPIPLHFSFPEGIPADSNMDEYKTRRMLEIFDKVNLELLSDDIVDGKMTPRGEAKPLALYTAPRVDISLHRLRHYTGTNAKHFQNFVLFTNYQFYVDEFRSMALDLMQKSDGGDAIAAGSKYTSFVEPGNHITYNQNMTEKAAQAQLVGRMPQMPAYHLTRTDGNGITLVNIGVGPSNAKNITDHIAVLRPHAWIMVGHCGGLRPELSMGDYILAHGYDRQDLVLDSKLPVNTVIPALAEIQLALQATVQEVTGQQGRDVRSVMRTGTVVTVADRNWELDGMEAIMSAFNASRAVAVDMESATLAANGFRHRVPYGTLLCVSDLPLHGQPKMPGPSEVFYRQRVAQHFRIGVRTCEHLRENTDALHSRKLRGAFEPVFR